ncbi:MAG: nuclear transport factor 2 family protein [Pseudomonadota bacterium]|nr:MAG: nuclear transport factor 2 family protein [Pseudomonadota bacterium]
MENVKFNSPEAAEEAFYRAFEQGDHTAMMRVWAMGDDTECIHPAGPRLRGHDAIARSWEVIFSSPGRYRIALEACNRVCDRGLAVHIVDERITVSVDPAQHALVTVTNAYRREADGWKMFLHHASQVTSDATQVEAGTSPPRRIH